MTSLVMSSDILDNGLAAFALANDIIICSSVPTSYSAALTASLGNSTFGIGGAFGSISGATDGEQISSNAVVTGIVTSSGTPSCWAAIDAANTRLLATGPMTGSVGVTTSNIWALTSLTIDMPGSVSVGTVTYATWNPTDEVNMTLSNGNLTALHNTPNSWDSIRCTIGKSIGKWYWEITINDVPDGTGIIEGISDLTNSLIAGNYIGSFANSGGVFPGSGNYASGITSNGGSLTTATGSDIFGLALDMNLGVLYISKNGVYGNSGDPVAGTGYMFSAISGIFFPAMSNYHLNIQTTANFGASAFSYSVPSGFKSGIYISNDGWQLSGASIDLDFVNSRVYPSTSDFANYLSCSRSSIGYAQMADGMLTQFAANHLRITDLGLLIEDVRTNVVLWNRDLTNILWIAVNVTAALDQTGVDGSANSASSIVATAGNGTILQTTVIASSARFQSAYVKRITGTGTINMTMDNGSTWTAIAVTSSWTLVSIPTQTLANPIVGFQIVTNGDKIAVDFVQNENGIFSSSPILTTTTSTTRAADVVTVTSTLSTILTSGVASMVVDFLWESASAPVGIFIGGNPSGWTTPLRLASNTTINVTGSDGSSPSAATLGNSLTFAGGAKAGSAWDAGPSISFVGGGGSVATSGSTPMALATTVYLGTADGTAPIFGTFRRLTVWNSKLADATLQGFTAP